MKGAILEKGETFYTDMKRVFDAINNVQNEYNWLITDLETNANHSNLDEYTSGYIWLSGSKITEIAEETEYFQWIWAVLSGFPKGVTKEQALQYELPYADGYAEFWKNPVTLQHPLATIEIVPWDSSLVLVISRDDKIVNDFLESMPYAEDLEDYNNHKISMGLKTVQKPSPS